MNKADIAIDIIAALFAYTLIVLFFWFLLHYYHARSWVLFFVGAALFWGALFGCIGLYVVGKHYEIKTKIAIWILLCVVIAGFITGLFYRELSAGISASVWILILIGAAWSNKKRQKEKQTEDEDFPEIPTEKRIISKEAYEAAMKRFKQRRGNDSV